MDRPSWDQLLTEAAQLADEDDRIAEQAEHSNTARLYYTVKAAWRAALRLVWCVIGDEGPNVAVPSFANLLIRLQRFSEIKQRDERLKEWSDVPRSFGKYFGRNSLDAALRFARDVHKVAISVRIVSSGRVGSPVNISPLYIATESDRRRGESETTSFLSQGQNWDSWYQVLKGLLLSTVLPDSSTTLHQLEGIAIAFNQEMESEAFQLRSAGAADSAVKPSLEDWPPDKGWHVRENKVAVLGNVWSPRNQIFKVIRELINCRTGVTSDRLIEVVWGDQRAVDTEKLLKKLRTLEDETNKHFQQQLDIGNHFKVLIREGTGRTAQWSMARPSDLARHMSSKKLSD